MVVTANLFKWAVTDHNGGFIHNWAVTDFSNRTQHLELRVTQSTEG